MAEPAHRLDDEQDKQPTIYDSPGTAPSRPRLKSLEGGESSEAKRGHLQPVDSEEPTQKELGDAEKGITEPDGHSLYKGSKNIAPSGFLRLPRTVFGTRRRKVFAGGAVAGAIVTASILIFLSLIPFKIMHIVNNLQERFYATSENAIQKQTDIMFKRYIREKVLPSYTNCGTTISRNCSVKVIGKNPVSNMYRTWADARIENKLADRHGIEFQKRPSGWYMITPSTGTRGVNIGGIGEKLDSQFEKANRSDIRRAVRAETKWYQMFFRYKVGKLLEQKYGIKRCIIFCTPKDALADKKDEKKIAAKLYLTQRVLVPRNEVFGLALICMLNNCVDNPVPTEAEAGKNGSQHGSPESKIDTEIRLKLTELTNSYGLADKVAIEALVKTYKEMSEKGFQKYLVAKLLEPAVGKTGAAGAGKAIPILGWVDLLARLIKSGDNANDNLKKLSYITNSSAAVSMFAMYRTYTDEMKTGNVDAEELGSFVQSLDSGDRGTKTDPQIGGNVGAEGAPLYGQLLGGEDNASQTSDSGSLIGKLFDPKVLAATAQGGDQKSEKFIYECNDGKPIKAGRIVCSEEVLGGGNKYAALVDDFLDIPGISSLTFLADLWLETVGKLFDVASTFIGYGFQAFGLACKLPGSSLIGFCNIKEKAEAVIGDVMEAVVKWLIPNPFSTNMSGGRTFDMIAAGADVAGNDSAHITLGGQKINDQQVAAIVDEQRLEELHNYNSQPLLARVFDTDSRYSPVTKLAMSMPLGSNSARITASNMFSNPIGKLGSAFSSVFRPNKVLAASPSPDPFGVVQYGYPAGAIPEDPEAYWDQNCSDNPSFAYRKDNKWNEDAAKNLDPGTRMPTNSEVNPCLLIMAVAGSAGGFFDSSNLTDDDLSNNSPDIFEGEPGSGGPPTGTGSIGKPSASLQNLAQQMLNNKNISYPLDSFSPNGSTKAVLQAIAAGNPAPVTCPNGSTGGVTSAELNPNILQAILDMAQSANIGVNALTDKCHSKGSNHYMGLAVDFECGGVPFNTAKNDAIAATYGGVRNSETCAKDDHWHYDFLTRP